MTRGSIQSLVLLATAALAAAGGFYGARLSGGGAAVAPATEPAEGTPAIPVAIEPVRRGELADMAHAFGVVQTRAAEAAILSVPFESQITRVQVTAGESVAAGTPLVDVDASPDARLQLLQAEQALAAAVQNAAQVARRRDEQLATNADVGTAEQALQSARTQLDAQKARGAGVARPLTADKAGVVTAVNVQPGQIAAAGTPLVVVAPDDSTEIRVGVDPADLDGVKVGDAVSVRVPNSTNTLAGIVRQQSRQLNAQRLCDVFVRLNGSAALRPGTFIEAAFARRTVSGLIVPRVATQLEDDAWCLYTVKDGKAARHVVTLDASDDKDIVVIGEGLADGDDVVVERNGELSDGVAVKAEAPDEDAK